ncbi:MAG: MFS transporter [Porticoccaceae bacterium]
MNSLEIRSLIGLVSLYATRMLGLFMVLPVMSLYGGDYTGSTTMLVGVALGIYGLTQGLFQIPLGMLSDRLGRKTIIVGGMVVFLLGSLVAATAESIHGLIIGRALQGAGAVASTIMALLSDLTTEQNRTKAMAAVGGSIGLSFALAMIVGPAIASSFGMNAIFWLTAALAIAGILVVIYWIPTPVAMNRLSSREALAMPALFGRTLANRELLRLDAGIFLLHMIQMASWVSVPFVLSNVLAFELSRHWWLYLLTMGFGFVAMLPFMIVAERKRILKWVFVGAVAVLAVAELLMYTAGQRFGVFVTGLFLFFMAFNLLEACLPSLVSKAAPSGTRGTAMGIYSSSQFLGAFVGGIAGGTLAQVVGAEAVFLFSAAMAIVWVLIAATMPRPRHWASVVIPLLDGEQVPNGASIRDRVAGVEDVLLIPDQRLVYLRVDKGLFDQPALEKLLGRPLVA